MKANLFSLALLLSIPALAMQNDKVWIKNEKGQLVKTTQGQTTPAKALSWQKDESGQWMSSEQEQTSTAVSREEFPISNDLLKTVVLTKTYQQQLAKEAELTAQKEQALKNEAQARLDSQALLTELHRKLTGKQTAQEGCIRQINDLEKKIKELQENQKQLQQEREGYEQDTKTIKAAIEEKSKEVVQEQKKATSYWSFWKRS